MNDFKQMFIWNAFLQLNVPNSSNWNVQSETLTRPLSVSNRGVQEVWPKLQRAASQQVSRLFPSLVITLLYDMFFLQKKRHPLLSAAGCVCVWVCVEFEWILTALGFLSVLLSTHRIDLWEGHEVERGGAATETQMGTKWGRKKKAASHKPEW